MRVLITGASGFLGKKIREVMSRTEQVAGTYLNNKVEGGIPLDIRDENQVVEIFEKIKPDAVIHTVAIADPDICEKDRELAWNINVIGTENIASVASDFNTKMVYISTDYVFDGENPPYSEKDDPSPINFYGETKLEGEKKVQELTSKHIITRVPVFYGYINEQHKDDFVRKVIKCIKNRQILRLDDKQLRYPTLTDDIAWSIHRLISLNKNGIFHISSDEPVTKYQWAHKIASCFELPNARIKRSEGQKGIAKRPHDTKLDNSKIKDIGQVIIGLSEGLEIMKHQERCSFRIIYLERPDKMLLDTPISNYRVNLGITLAKEHPAKADMIIPVPESGIFAASGYASESGIPLYFGLIRDTYTMRTLFEPKYEMRHIALRKKLIAVPDLVASKDIVLMDEAILSGATLSVAIKKLKDANARKIHVRIPSPPFISRCNFKILNPKAKFIADSIRFIERDLSLEDFENELIDYFDVDSLKFFEMERFLEIIKKEDVPCVSCLEGNN